TNPAGRENVRGSCLRFQLRAGHPPGRIMSRVRPGDVDRGVIEPAGGQGRRTLAGGLQRRRGIEDPDCVGGMGAWGARPGLKRSHCEGPIMAEVERLTKEVAERFLRRRWLDESVPITRLSLAPDDPDPSHPLAQFTTVDEAAAEVLARSGYGPEPLTLDGVTS